MDEFQLSSWHGKDSSKDFNPDFLHATVLPVTLDTPKKLQDGPKQLDNIITFTSWNVHGLGMQTSSNMVLCSWFAIVIQDAKSIWP